MHNVQTMNRQFATIGWSALLIWWGIVIVVEPLTVGIGALGTGLLLLGVNSVRWLKGIPTRPATTAVGIVALVWGTLDHALALGFGPSFALLLMVVGVVTLASELLRVRKTDFGEERG